MAEKNVIVIGAGVAGLAAGRLLAEAGAKVTVLESRDRIGGRIYTLRSGDRKFELGAEFVHGLPPELWQLLEEANLRTEELDGRQICYEQGELKNCGSGWEHDLEMLEQLKEWRKRDCPFADFLDQQRIEGARREHLVSYVEGFNAADHRAIGVTALGKQQAAEDEIDGARIFRVCEGYARVPEFLAEKLRSAGGEILLDTHVQSIAWKPGSVAITGSARGKVKRFTANSAVITLPLGVLQQGSVQFAPEPAKILHAAQSLRMGHVRRADLFFRERFWADEKYFLQHPPFDDLSFLFAFQQIPSTWWTQFPSRNGNLTAWVGGPRADTLAELNAADLSKKICGALSKMFRMDAKQMDALLVECHSHDWQRDPYSLGAYSYVPAGAISAPDEMTQPVEDTLYFAGEHTDTTGHWGTVHAALRSGVRAAKQILNS